MFDRVNALLETEGTALVEKHEDVIVEAMTLVNDFQKDIKAFILNNPEEFIGENVDETFKNIRVFAEVGVAQYVQEISNLYGSSLQEQEVVAEATEDKGLQEYL
jgi:hypothetical protein